MEYVCLASIRQLISLQGISAAAADRIGTAWKNINGIDAARKSWASFCELNNVDPLLPSVPHLCDWMLYMEEKHYCGATIKLYKCAVAQTFKILFNVKLGEFLAMKKFVRLVSMKDPVLTKPAAVFLLSLKHIQLG